MLHAVAPVTVVALPGTGSDADFAAAAFGAAADAVGADLAAVAPDPRAVVASYRAALDAAARRGPVLAAGISLGAAVALDWAADHPDSATGVMAALPAWTGPAGKHCPAAVSATVTAAQLRADGLDAVVARMQADSPAWLAAALTRSWRQQWPDLPGALDEAAAYSWPTESRLGEVTAPVAVLGAVDDPVHPLAVAEQWAAALPDSRWATFTLDELGAAPAILSHLGLRALARPAQFLPSCCMAEPPAPRRG